MGAAVPTTLLSSDDFDANRLAFISAKLISFPAGFFVFAPTLPFPLLCDCTHDVPPVALGAPLAIAPALGDPFGDPETFARTGTGTGVTFAGPGTVAGVVAEAIGLLPREAVIAAASAGPS